MPNHPKSLKYTQDHEWVHVEEGIATIGITDHAQDQLGDIVYLGDMPEAGDSVEKGDVVGVIESVKATSDIFAPISGEIVEINSDLIESPEIVNSDPYEEGWMLRIRFSDRAEVDDLLSADQYEELIEE
jgi:glycine cleavage system H protein